MIAAQEVLSHRVSVRLPAPERTGLRPVNSIANLAAGEADLQRAPDAAAKERRRLSDERAPGEERRQGERRKTKSFVLLDTRVAPRRQREGEPHVRINVKA